jgi:PAS domain-containing protein
MRLDLGLLEALVAVKGATLALTVSALAVAVGLHQRRGALHRALRAGSTAEAALAAAHVLTITTDRSGRIRSTCPGVAQLLGCASRELVGRELVDLLPASADALVALAAEPVAAGAAAASLESLPERGDARRLVRWTARRHDNGRDVLVAGVDLGPIALTQPLLRQLVTAQGGVVTTSLYGAGATTTLVVRMPEGHAPCAPEVAEGVEARVARHGARAGVPPAAQRAWVDQAKSPH